MASDSSSHVAPALPSEQQVVALLTDEFGRAGYEIEDVSIDTRTRPARLTVVADGDTPLDLETVTELSRAASELLDTVGTDDGAYVLEVTSRGVDRPLTTAKHFRRAKGRLADFTLADGSTLSGRIGELLEGTLQVVVRGRNRAVPQLQDIELAEVTKAVVQVEFSAPNKRELELAGVSGEESGTA
ncbi:MAG: ribosome maturation factor RimP [Mycobacterium sp.]